MPQKTHYFVNRCMVSVEEDIIIMCSSVHGERMNLTGTAPAETKSYRGLLPPERTIPTHLILIYKKRAQKMPSVHWAVSYHHYHYH